MLKMMKGALTVLLAKSSIAESAILQGSRVINGSYKADNTTISERLIINGEAVLGKNTIVKEAITINGSLKADGATFEAKVSVNGASNIANSIFKETASFSGNLTAENSQFSKLFVQSKESIFSSCNFNDVTLKPIPYAYSSQIVKLKNSSVVSENVTFEMGKGEVHIDATSQVKGDIIGGRRVYK